MNKLQKTVAKLLGFSSLIDSANWQQRYQRPYQVTTANSLATDVSLADLTLLISDSRQLYWNLGPVTGAIDDKATYSVGRAWDAKFCGEDEEWGDEAAEWLNKIWYPMADVRGGMFNFKTDLRLMSTATDVDGEVYVFLTESDTGWPQIQLIPSTMIGQRDTLADVRGGPYDGLQICQGVIFNDKGTAVAYRVLGASKDEDKDYSARDLIQIGDPKTCDQVRFFPVFTHALLDLRDLRTIQGNEKMVSAICSTIGLMEHNELGAPDPNDPANFLRKSNNILNGTDTVGPQVTTQNFSGVSARFFRAGTGSKLEQLKMDRPGEVWDKFMNRLIRNACAGAGWPYELTWDSSQLGGANVRLLLARAMRTVEDRQDLLRPVARRIVGYAIAKAIKSGLLPPNKEWYEWDFAMPARMTVDYGRDANSDREDYKLGILNLSDILREEGRDLETHINERVAENEALEEAGLPVYGPGPKEAVDVNAPVPVAAPTAAPEPTDAEEAMAAIAETQKILSERLDAQETTKHEPSTINLSVQVQPENSRRIKITRDKVTGALEAESEPISR